MRAVVQRVSRAQVDIDGQAVGAIERGLLILLGVGHDDTEQQAERLWSKIARLRIFEDADAKTNLSLADANRLYEWFVERARRDVSRVETGRFGAYMDVSLVNDGPFTLWLDSDAL